MSQLSARISAQGQQGEDQVLINEPDTQPRQEGRSDWFHSFHVDPILGSEGQAGLPEVSGFHEPAAEHAASLRCWLNNLVRAPGNSADSPTSHRMRSELQKIAAEKARLQDNMVALQSELLLHQECELRVAELIARLSEARSRGGFQPQMLLQIVEDINDIRMDRGPAGLSLLAVNFGKQLCNAWEGNCWQALYTSGRGPDPSQAVATTMHHNATTVSTFSAAKEAVIFPISAGRFAGKAATRAQLQQLSWAGFMALTHEYHEQCTHVLDEVASPSAERMAAVMQELGQLQMEMINLMIVHCMHNALSTLKEHVPEPVHEIMPVIRRAVSTAGISQAQAEALCSVQRQQQGHLDALDRRLTELEGKIQTQLQSLGGCLAGPAGETDAYQTLLDTAMQLKIAIIERGLAEMVTSFTFYFRHTRPFQMAMLWVRSFPFKPRMEYLQMALESVEENAP